MLRKHIIILLSLGSINPVQCTKDTYWMFLSLSLCNSPFHFPVLMQYGLDVSLHIVQSLACKQANNDKGSCFSFCIDLTVSISS